MKITYDLNQEDFWQFNKYAVMRIPSFRRNLIGNLIAPPFVGAIVLSELGIPFIFTASITLILFATTSLLLLVITRRQIKNLLDDSSQLGKHTMTIDLQGLREKNAVSDSAVSWSGVKDITENNDYIYIFIAPHIANVIPKRAFGRSEDARAFFEQAEKFWKEAVGA